MINKIDKLVTNILTKNKIEEIFVLKVPKNVKIVLTPPSVRPFDIVTMKHFKRKKNSLNLSCGIYLLNWPYACTYNSDYIYRKRWKNFFLLDLLNPPYFEPEMFDYVFNAQVIEHIPIEHTQKLIDYIGQISKEGLVMLPDAPYSMIYSDHLVSFVEDNGTIFYFKNPYKWIGLSTVQSHIDI